MQAKPSLSGLLSGRTRLLVAACLLIGTQAPQTVMAHVKWFEPAAQYPLRLDLIPSERTLLWLLTSGLAVAALYGVARVLALRTWPWSNLLRHMAVGAPTLLAIQAAIGLVSNAVHPSLLAPNLTLQPGGLADAIAVVQVLIALSFITGVGDWLGGLMLVGLVAAVAVLFSPVDALEQIFWAGIGIVMATLGRGSEHSGVAWPWLRRNDPVWTQRMLTVLRITTAASLIVVALTEKLWNPALGRAFLLDRPELNVFQSLPGMAWFSNDTFVLVAGLTEAAIGAMLISGFATRLVILGMWLPFNLGIPVLPSQELLGHLPILGIMYVLLVSDRPIQRKQSNTVNAQLPEAGLLPAVPIYELELERERERELVATR